METTVQFLHVLSACILVGSTIFVGFVLIPTLRNAMDDAGRMGFLRKMSSRSKMLMWPAIFILLATGFYRIAELGPYPWQTGYGTLLKAKIGLVFVFAILAFLHDFVLGARVVSMNPKDSGFKNFRRLTIIFSQFQLVALLAIIVLAVKLRLYTW